MNRHDRRSPAGGLAQRYASELLREFGITAPLEPCDAGARPPPHPALAWARSGAMALTGPAEGAPVLAPGCLTEAAEGAHTALAALAANTPSLARSPRRPARPDTANPGVGGDAAAMLGERAAAFGYSRGGPLSPSGSCRLLATRDGFLAVQLARDDDWSMVPAWLGGDTEASGPDEAPREERWTALAARLRPRRSATLIERARLLGLPVAEATAPPRSAPPWLRRRRLAECDRAVRARGAPLVLDFTSLWAGPLCGSLLAAVGARVVKIESVDRPDGARRGPASFFDLMNAGKRACAFDPSDATSLDALHQLAASADIVIEASRPRALAQLGLDAERWLRARPGRVWTSITGYGREEPNANWVAFGDDAAVAAGLAVATGTADAPLFCGDAIADPLTGLHAAVATRAAWQQGGGELLALALRDVTAHALLCDLGVDARAGALVRASSGPAEDGSLDRSTRETRWIVETERGTARVAPPRMRAPIAAAPALGELPLPRAATEWAPCGS